MSSEIELRSHCECEPASHKMFNGEIALHFGGLEGLKKPIVWVFPKISICMSCGAARFSVPERELTVLASGKRAAGAIVLDQSDAETAQHHA